MPNLAMRLETYAGSYTEVTGETNSVFDISVVVGKADGDGELSEDLGRTVLPAEGFGMVLRATSSGDIPAPSENILFPLETGMFADNPLTDEGEIAEAVAAVVNNRGTKMTAYTFMGDQAIDAAVAELRGLEPEYHAVRVLGAAEFVLNHTRASV